MIYLILFLWMCFLAHLLDINGCKTKFVCEGQNTPFFGFNSFKFKRKLFLFCFFFIATLIMGFRGQYVGEDTAEYKNIFSYVDNKSWARIFSEYGIFTQFEIGYAVFMKICSYVCNNYFYFQFVNSALFCLGMATFIYSDTDDLLMRVVIFIACGIYLRAFDIARQAMAVMLLLNAWKCLKNKKRVCSIALYLLAVTIHSTSFVFIVVFIIEWLKKYDKFLLAFAFIFFIFVICCEPLVSFALSFFPKYSDYLFTGKIISPGMVMLVWLIITVLSLSVLYHKTQFTKDQKAIAIYCLIYVGANIIGIRITYFERFSYYFMPFIIMLYPMCKRNAKELCIENLYTFSVQACYFFVYLLDVIKLGQYVTFI